MKKFNKYRFYEASVQEPAGHSEWFSSIYKALVGKEARHLREDFCGTFRDSIAWVKFHDENTALGLDLDPEPIHYGETRHRPELSEEQSRRLRVMHANVLKPTSTKSDLIIACNFSFYIFKERKLLLKYLKSCLKSLRKQGLLVLEMAGGPGMIAPMRERKTVKLSPTEKFTYIWHQKSFNPITHDAQYAIHFQLPGGAKVQDAFIYDWRFWTIPEVRDAMVEVGFKKVTVFWESSHRGEGTGEYMATEQGDNAYAWIAYVVGSA